MKRFLAVFTLLLGAAAISHAATSTASPVLLPTTIMVSSVSASGGQAQVLITTPSVSGPYSSGFYNYISHIRIEQYAAGTLTGGASPTTCTTSGLNGIVFKFPTALATGAMTATDMELTNALQATQAANTSITCPATASVIWNVNISYYQTN